MLAFINSNEQQEGLSNKPKTMNYYGILFIENCAEMHLKEIITT